MMIYATDTDDSPARSPRSRGDSMDDTLLPRPFGHQKLEQCKEGSSGVSISAEAMSSQ